MNVEDILLRFESVSSAGVGKWRARCPHPEHNDSEPSVSISQDINTGSILLYCWGCNRKAPELTPALGIRVADLFGDPGHPTAIQQASQDAEVSPDDQANLEQRVKAAVGRLDEAKDYIFDRFNLTVEDGRSLGLGVDSDFGSLHLIIPLLDPDGKIVGMQGRRLIEGEPRWRSVTGVGWSKLGCFGWNIHTQGPVIITEGLSDSLAVVGRVYLPAIGIRGASNTSQQVCEQLKEWIGDKEALIVGDAGSAGELFAHSLHEGTGIPYWIPSRGDLCEYLADGGNLDGIIPGSIVTIPTETPEEQSTRLQTVIELDVDRACYNDELKQELSELPNWQVDALLANCVANAAYGQRGVIRQRVGALHRAVEAMNPPPVHVGGGGGLHAPIPAGFDPQGLPEIIWNIEDQLHVTEHSIRGAMDDYSSGEYYRSATGQYVKIVEDDLVNLKESGVKSMLSQMAHWRIINGQRETGHVPTEASRLITDPSWQCGLPEIKRRVEVPFMLGSGEIISNIGYHEESGIYLLPRLGDYIEVPPVPVTITDEHVAEARKILEDVTEGFMFKDQAAKSNLIAMTLTSPLRELFRSNPMVPLLTSTAPQSGSGKGTSIRVPLSTCGVGPYSLSTTAYNSDENEFEKKLVGKLLKKSTYIFLDNIRSTVSSSVMEQMLTAANYDGRTLGYSEVNALSTLVLWVCTLQSTGAFNRDLTRRCVPVELIKNYRGKWKHKNIEAYLADKRGEMIWACFVVARRWLDGGGQISEARLDGYGGWTEVIGGILENVLGYEEFLGNLDSFRASQDENAMTIDGLLERWLLLYGEAAKPARMAIEDYEDPALHQLLNLHNPSTRQTLNSLTRLLDSQRGYIISNTHCWEPLGMMPFGHEGMVKQYRAVPLPEED